MTENLKTDNLYSIARKELIKGSVKSTLKIITENIDSFSASIDEINFTADVFCMNDLSEKALKFLDNCYYENYNNLSSDNNLSSNNVLEIICSKIALKKLEVLSENSSALHSNEKNCQTIILEWINKVQSHNTGSEEFMLYAIDCLQNASLFDKALEICKKAITLYPEDISLKEKYYKLIKLSSQKKSIFTEINDSAIEKIFLKYFAGRKDIFAKQVKFKRGNYGYVPVRSMIDKNVIKAHLNGDLSVGIYQLDLDSMVSFLAFDIDIKKKYLPEFENESVETTHLLNALYEVLKYLCHEISKYKMDYLVEFSGHKGFHVWIFLAETMPAKSVKAVGKHILSKVKLPETISIEVFPKQEKIKDGGLGNLIKLPLGIHKKTGKRSWFCQRKNFEPLENYAEHLGMIKKVSRNEFLDILAQITGIDYPNYVKQKGQQAFADEKFSWAEYERIALNKDDYSINDSSKDYSDKDYSNKDTQNSRINQFNTRPQPQGKAESVVSGCGVIAAIVEKALSTHSLEHAEKHVLIYVMACTGDEGRTFLHQILSKTLDYNTHALSNYIHSVPPNPMSCPKIRKHLRTIADLTGCRCRFNLEAGEYPSPIIYARLFPQKSDISQARNKITPQTKIPDDDKKDRILQDTDVLDALVSEYKRQKKEFEIKAHCLDRVVREIESCFLKRKTLTINTELGTYIMKEAQEEIFRCQTIKFDFANEESKSQLMLPEST